MEITRRFQTAAGRGDLLLRTQSTPFLITTVLALLPSGSISRADTLYVGTESRDINKINRAGAISVFATLPATSVYSSGVAFDVSGNLFASDPNKDRINKITSSGDVSVFATLPSGSFPLGLAFDGSGNLYAANNAGRQITKITPSGTLSTFATLPLGAFSDGLAFDVEGNLYVADSSSDLIRKVSSLGMVSTFAALPTGSGASGLAFDISGNLFAALLAADQISRITTSGLVSVFATLPANFQPVGLAFDTGGILYAAGVGAQISKITPTGVVSPFVSGATTFTYVAVTDDAGRPLPLPPVNVPEPRTVLLLFAALLVSATNRERWRMPKIGRRRRCSLNLRVRPAGNFSAANNASGSMHNVAAVPVSSVSKSAATKAFDAKGRPHDWTT